MKLEVQIAVAKTKKYATSNSGDTVEVIERPQGGVSVVLADGQSSGRGAKWISTLVVRKVITLLAEGVRDGAAARAASDNLFTERSGRVSSTLNIISIDQQTQTIVLTRNNPAPSLLVHRSNIRILDEPCQPVGLYRGTRPVITEVPLEEGLIAVVYSDGVVHAGTRYGEKMDVELYMRSIIEEEVSDPRKIADGILENAMKLDQNRPSDDISVVVLSTLPYSDDEIRRMSVRLPIQSWKKAM
jgi:serine phosphatase RsbU (regulator of sigma subunit)